jgi:hypothetical protein
MDDAGTLFGLLIRHLADARMADEVTDLVLAAYAGDDQLRAVLAGGQRDSSTGTGEPGRHPDALYLESLSVSGFRGIGRGPASPPVAKCRSRRAQFLLLRGHASPDIARPANHAWASLSRAGHHQSYELALTSQELRALGAEVAEVMAALKVQA